MGGRGGGNCACLWQQLHNLRRRGYSQDRSVSTGAHSIAFTFNVDDPRERERDCVCVSVCVCPGHTFVGRVAYHVAFDFNIDNPSLPLCMCVCVCGLCVCVSMPQFCLQSRLQRYI